MYAVPICRGNLSFYKQTDTSFIGLCPKLSCFTQEILTCAVEVCLSSGTKMLIFFKRFESLCSAWQWKM